MRPLLGSIGFAAALALATSAALADCSQPLGRDFPKGDLAQVRLNARALADLNAEIDAGTHEVRALLIVRDCRLVFERYKTGLSREHIHVVHSVTKSVTVTLAGNLLLEGSLRSLDVPVASLASKPPDTTADQWKKTERILLRHALGMASGIEHHNSPTGLAIYNPANDALFESVKAPLVAEPGARFNYSNGDATLYGAAIAGAARTDLLSLARRALFGPLEFGRHEWNYKDRTGRYPAGWSLRLRPMDMAKLGQLYLQEGRWNTGRIFSPSFRQQAWTAGPAPYYGLGWWLAQRPEFSQARLVTAEGWKGQRIFIYPTLNMLAVVVSSLPDDEEKRLMGPLPVQVLRAAQDGYRPDAPSEQRLAAAAAAGFHGQLRVHQYPQDLPGL